MLTSFVGKIIQQMFYWLWKLNSNTCINNHFIIKYFKYMVWSVGHSAQSPFSSEIFHITSLFFNVTFYMARYTEVNAALNNLLYLNTSI